MYLNTRKPGQWETVKPNEKKKKETSDKKEARDRLGVAVDPSAAAFAAFDRSFAAKDAAAAAKQQEQKKGYKGAFADLEDEAPPQKLQEAANDDSGDEAEATGSSSTTAAGAQKKPKAPKAPKKPKLSVAQVAAGIDVSALQSWMAEVQQRYSANESAQLEALSDRLLSAFKEASLDLAKIIATKGLHAASQQPMAELPNPLMNALASFAAGVNESALVAVLVPLVNAVVTEATGAASAQGPAGKGKAGLMIMLAVLLRTRPQALMQAAGDLRLAGRQLSGSAKLPVLLWVVNQAALADAAVGVAVWVRLLLPQLLGLLELPSSGGTSSKVAKAGAAAVAGGDQAQLLVPLDVPSQKAALQFLAGLLSNLGVGAGGAASVGGDITRGDGALEPTVPGAAVELLSRLIAGAAWAPTPAAAGGAAGSGEGKKASAARAAAAEGLAPLLPGLTALAAVSSCGRQYSEWLVLALESASLSAAGPDSPDPLVLRSASNVVACLCGNDSCFALWEGKHKGGLKGSARVLAALVQQPQLLGPLLQQRSSVDGFRGLLAALPARHRSHLATGKGWQGHCARVAEDACNKLPKKLGRGGWGSRGGKGAGGSGGGVGPVMTVLGLGSVLGGVLVVSGLYRREVAGVVAAYAGKDVAQQLEQQLLVPLEAGVQEGMRMAEPYLQQLQEAAGPTLAAAWEKVGPVVEQAQVQVVGPAVAALQQAYEAAVAQLQDIAAKAKQG